MTALPLAGHLGLFSLPEGVSEMALRR